MARIRNIGPETMEKLEMYFTGKLDEKIQLFKNKTNKVNNNKWPDEYYCTLHSTSYVTVTKNSNGISDPTGYKATKLADLTLNINNNYKYHKRLKSTIEEVLERLNDYDVLLIKGKLRLIEGGVREVCGDDGYKYRKARK